jgi:RNA polymerase sigma factor (sigma-70 family)
MDERDAELYAKYGPDLLRLSTMLVGPADAEDVFADALINATAAARWRSLDDDAKRGYLYRTVVNQGRQWARARTRRNHREALMAARDATTDSPSYPTREAWDVVVRLDMRARAVVFLTYWADLDGQGVADTLGISERSVRRVLARAREELRRSLDA